MTNCFQFFSNFQQKFSNEKYTDLLHWPESLINNVNICNMVRTLTELAQDESFVLQLGEAIIESKSAIRSFLRTEEVSKIN